MVAAHAGRWPHLRRVSDGRPVQGDPPRACCRCPADDLRAGPTGRRQRRRRPPSGVHGPLPEPPRGPTRRYVLVTFDLTAWGWVQLLLGILVAGAGFAIVKGQTWARIVGIALACLSLIASFLFMPHYPLWSLSIIALDFFVIWALATYRREAL